MPTTKKRRTLQLTPTKAVLRLWSQVKKFRNFGVVNLEAGDGRPFRLVLQTSDTELDVLTLYYGVNKKIFEEAHRGDASSFDQEQVLELLELVLQQAEQS